ncbi:hypothetical protein ES705_33740 [subsurface metagenome]
MKGALPKERGKENLKGIGDFTPPLCEPPQGH